MKEAVFKVGGKVFDFKLLDMDIHPSIKAELAKLGYEHQLANERFADVQTKVIEQLNQMLEDFRRDLSERSREKFGKYVKFEFACCHRSCGTCMGHTEYAKPLHYPSKIRIGGGGFWKTVKKRDWETFLKSLGYEQVQIDYFFQLKEIRERLIRDVHWTQTLANHLGLKRKGV